MNPLGLRVWNYNKSLEDTSRGIKAVQLFLDGKPLSPPGGHLIAKAPGHDAYDFGQFIPLHPGLLEGGSGSPESRGASIYSAGMEASAWMGAMADPVAAMRIWSAARRGKSHCGMVRQVDQPHLPAASRSSLKGSDFDAFSMGLRRRLDSQCSVNPKP